MQENTSQQTATERYKRLMKVVDWLGNVDIKELEEVIAEHIEGGFGDPLYDAGMVLQARDLLDSAVKQLKPYALIEAEKYGKGEHKYKGLVFQVKEAGTKYNYKGFPEWVRAKEVLTKIETELKPVAPKTSTTTVFYY